MENSLRIAVERQFLIVKVQLTVIVSKFSKFQELFQNLGSEAIKHIEIQDFHLRFRKFS